VRGLQARDHGRLADVYSWLVVDDESVARGLADGSLVEDTRLRDALRGLGRAAALSPGRFALDDAALRDADVVRAVRRLDDLRVRIESLERG
jgi:hypothetical protein